MASLIIVCGLPGSGKTRAARRLADLRGAHRFNADEWLADLGISRWDGGARTRVEELQWKMAKELLDLGISVIIEWGTWVRSERERVWREARALGATVEMCALDGREKELNRLGERTADKPTETADDASLWREVFEPPNDEELARYDKLLVGVRGGRTIALDRPDLHPAQWTSAHGTVTRTEVISWDRPARPEPAESARVSV